MSEKTIHDMSDRDLAVKFGRVRITWEPVTGGDDDAVS